MPAPARCRFVALLTATVAVLGGGCIRSDFFVNNTAIIEGNVTIVIVNDTGFRAIGTIGTFNDLDRAEPRPVNLRAFRVEANTTSANLTITCARNLAIATEKLVDWVSRGNEPDAAGFDAAALNAEVFFSDAPQDSANADAPTAGRAAGLEMLLGTEFSCGDRIIITFVEDGSVPGGFRIEEPIVIKDEDLR